MWNWIYRENVYASKDAGCVMIPYPCQVTVKTINGYASDWDQGSLNGTSMPMLVLVIVRPFKLVLTELMELFFKHSFVCARKWYGINVLYRLSIDYIWSSLLHYVTLCCTSRCVLVLNQGPAMLRSLETISGTSHVMEEKNNPVFNSPAMVLALFFPTSFPSFSSSFVHWIWIEKQI